MNGKIEIKKGTSFLSADKLAIDKYRLSLLDFYNNFEKALSIPKGIPVVLDTNILLRYYSISFHDRKLLFDYLKQIKDDIYITDQVLEEFINNRERIIDSFLNDTLKTFRSEVEKNIVNNIVKFASVNKELLKDYPDLNATIEKFKVEFEVSLESVTKISGDKRNENIDLSFVDEFLDFVVSLKKVLSISDSERSFLIKEYKDAVSKITKDKLKNDLKNKSILAFPGVADVLEKGEEGYGDYLLYHEIIKEFSDADNGVIFLTFDVTKGDWLTYDKKPYLHYVTTTFSINSNRLYILDANRIFESKLETSLESLISNNVEINENLLKVDSEDFMDNMHDLLESYNYLEKILEKLLQSRGLHGNLNSYGIRVKLDMALEMIETEGVYMPDNLIVNLERIYTLRNDYYHNLYSIEEWYDIQDIYDVKKWVHKLIAFFVNFDEKV